LLEEGILASACLNWKVKLVFGICTAGLVFAVLFPLFSSFFTPQDFVSFLNPLKQGTAFGRYMVESWSWTRDTQLVGFFRPLTSMTFLVEFPFFKDDPVGYMITNILFHLICVYAVIRLVSSLTRSRPSALFAGMLFAVHPGTVESIGLIVARHDILACLFSLLAVASVVRLSRSPASLGRALLPSIFVMLALSSKELGMANFICLPIMYFLWPGGDRNRRNTVVLLLSLLLTAAVYFLSRILIFGDIGGYHGYTPLPIMHWRMGTLILQITGAAFLGRPPVRILWLAFLVLTVLVYARRDLLRWRKVLLAVLVIGGYGFQSIIGENCAHYVYTPSAFFIAFLAALAGDIRLPLRRWKYAAATCIIAVILAAGMKTRRESIRFSGTTAPIENMYIAVGERLDSFIPGEHYVILLLQDSDLGREVKNMPLYLDYYLPDNGCSFSFTDRVAERNTLPVITWNGAEIEIEYYGGSG
jgi:hypothetical protein